MAHALQHLNAWLELEAVAVDRVTRQPRERFIFLRVRLNTAAEH
jgi:hypothetical protein